MRRGRVLMMTPATFWSSCQGKKEKARKDPIPHRVDLDPMPPQRFNSHTYLD